ncbi:unnamed protein product, partial [Closterium sp. NIES-53]
HLEDNRLAGFIPPSMGLLTRLTTLALTRNQLYGSFLPEFKDFTDLQYLYLDDNQFTGGVLDVSGLTKLVILNLQRNSLTGPVPASLGRLSEMRYLYLNHNQLSGTIPDIFAPLTKLYNL